ncbi:MAG: DUF2971 domain-containing protein [Oscillospiraceae bacterium]|nr:DUF2971 domain-containing protein [Oscillospiraceae bacterium]
MLYYRYRSGNELSIKELIYDELYFASREECNDPYEGRTFATFSADEGLWNKLINVALGVHKISFDENLKAKIIHYFVDKSPMQMESILRLSREEFTDIGQNQLEKYKLTIALNEIQNYVMCYCPEERYFASFSKTNDNFLLWSHYANNHSGFCLIYRTIDGKLKQNPSWKNNRIVLPHSEPKVSFEIPESFEMCDVEYISTPKYSDAFMCFPESVTGNNRSAQEIKEALTLRSNCYFQKHKVWDYEQEVRVVLSSGLQWIAGKELRLSTYQRLFHIDSTQVVGIVLGARTSDAQRQRIKEIISEKVERWFIPASGHRIISSFVLFDETLSETNREVIIEPREIYSGTAVILNQDPKFTRLYEDWQDGWVLEFNDNSAKRVQVK